MSKSITRSVSVELLMSLCDLSSQVTLTRRVVMELHNLFIHCNYESFDVDPPAIEKQDYVIVTKNIERALAQARESGTTVVLLGCSVAKIASLRLAQSHPSTYIERSRYVVIFNNYLPKQHYVL